MTQHILINIYKIGLLTQNDNKQEDKKTWFHYKFIFTLYILHYF